MLQIYISLSMEQIFIIIKKQLDYLMILNNPLLELSCFLVFCTVVICETSASRSQPANMQTKKIQIYTSPTTNTNLNNFSFTYDNSLVLTPAGSNQPVGLITMSSIDFTPVSSQSFSCGTKNVTTTFIQITCTISSLTTINKLVYNYFVMARDQSYFVNGVLKTQLFIQQIYANASTIGIYSGLCIMSRGHNLNGTNYMRGFVFSRGIEHSRPISTFNVNMTLNISSSSYAVHFEGVIIGVSGTNPISKVYLSILIFDMPLNSLNRNYSIVDAILTYRYGQPVTSIPAGIDTTTSWMLIGLKSFSFQDSQPFTFQFSYSINDIGFNSQLPYNEIQYVWITQLSCPTSTYLERAQGTCKTDRNGCTNYYQYISGASNSQITALYMHNSMKMFAVASQFEIRIYRHNSASFIFYTSLYIPLQSSKINKMEFSTDFSRVAILCFNCGFYIYSWNGTNYNLDYMLPQISNTILVYYDFSIKQDFKMLTIIYRQDGIFKRITLTYNSQTRNYSISRILEQTKSGTRLHVNYARNQAYFHNSYYIEYMAYDTNLQFFAPYLPSTYLYESSNIISAISGDKETLVLDYTRTRMNPNNAIRVLQYDQTQRMFVFHSEIKSIDNQNFGVSNYLKLSYGGLKLLVKAVGSFVESSLIFERASIMDEFVLTEIITNPQPISLNFTKSLGFIDATDNFQTILSCDGTTNVVLYYCPSTIPNISTIYQIPIAVSMFTTAQYSQLSQTSTKIDSLGSIVAQSNEKVQADVNNLEQNTKQIKDLLNILLLACYVLAAVITIGLLIFIAKCIRNIRTNPQSKIIPKKQLRLCSDKLQPIIIQNSQLNLKHEKYEKSINSLTTIICQAQQKNQYLVNQENQPYNLAKKEEKLIQTTQIKEKKRKRQRFPKNINIRQEQPATFSEFQVQI